MQIDTIHNVQKFRRVLPYSQLTQCFPRKIRPQDIDGEVEISGHFLWMEWSEQIPTFTGGDWLAAFKRIWAMGKRGCVFYIQHQPTTEANVTLEMVARFWVVRRRSWLQTHKDYIRARGPFNGENLCEAIEEWANHTQEIPNDFDWRYSQGPDAGTFYVEPEYRSVLRVTE